MSTTGWIILAAIAIPVVLVIIWFAATYNRLVRTRQHIRDSWSQIDVELKRRYELIPNLVETVKGYASHEQETLEGVVELRNKAMANEGRASSQAADESELVKGLGRLFALAESYPDLKADSNFRELQQELANTEDRIAAARRFYNGNVREMNALVEMFPSNFVARSFGFQMEDYFELDSEAERVAPKVSFA